MMTVDESGDVETAIESAAEDASLVIMGATERGLLSRLVADSLHMDVVDEVDVSVLLTEREGGGLRERLFGRR
jgi:nucleotide-binding universal stress UspA family protein